jgi:NAD(P)-dependent dehydrogenase (short-subunit alcohol dehydrogenase family)
LRVRSVLPAPAFFWWRAGAGKLADAAAGLSREDIAARSLSFDLADAAAIDAIIAQLREQGPPIHILVNAAGVNLRQPFAEVSAAISICIRCCIYVHLFCWRRDWRRLWRRGAGGAF